MVQHILNQPRWKYVCLSIYVAIFLLFFYFVIVLRWPLHYPYSDMFHHLAQLHELQKDFISVNDPFFATGPRDPHYGPYIATISLVAKILNIDILSLFLVMGLINLILFVGSAIVLGRAFFNVHNRELENKACYLLPILMLICWGGSAHLMSGDFSLGLLLVAAPFPATFSLGLTLLNIGFVRRFLQEPSLRLYTTILITTLVIFLSHITTGIMFFVLLIVFTLLRRNRTSVAIVLVIPATLLLSLIWPYFSVIDVFTSVGTVHTSEFIPAFPIETWHGVVGPILPLGVLALVRRKDKFLILWFVAFFIINISYFFPIRPSSFWRFFPLMLVPVYLSFTEEFMTFKNNLKVFVLLSLVVIGFVSFGNSLIYPKMEYGLVNPIEPSQFEFLGIVPKDSIILSDPITSYHVAGLKGFTVVSVTPNHSNPLNIPETIDRYDQTMRFLKLEMSSTEIDKFLSAYRPDYLLIDKKTKVPDYLALKTAYGNKSIAYENGKFVLIKLDYDKGSKE